jgi:hypothetical protein
MFDTTIWKQTQKTEIIHEPSKLAIFVLTKLALFVPTKLALFVPTK